MTPQEIFNTVAEHLFEQGVQSAFSDASVNSNPRCFYRAKVRNRATGQEHVLKCAVGCLMSDEDYRPEMDIKIDPRTGFFVNDSMSYDTSIKDIINNFDHLPGWYSDNMTLLIDLQDAHDHDTNWQSSAEMRIGLKKVAKDHNLNFDILENLSFNNR